MANTKKKKIISSLVNTLSKRDSVILVDYTNLSHEQLADVRKKLFEAGGVLRVVKNNLFIIALKDASLPIPDKQLIGPTAVLFTTSDDPSAIKELRSQGRELNKLEVKWGIWDKELIDRDKIEYLAELPSRSELLSKFIGSLKSPQIRLISTLKGNLQKLVVAFEEIKKQKEK